MKEKLLLLEQRYVLAAKDYSRAEILALIDAELGPISYENIAERMLVPVSKRTIARALEDFEGAGIVSRVRGDGGYIYTVSKQYMWNLLTDHGIDPRDTGMTIQVPRLSHAINAPQNREVSVNETLTLHIGSHVENQPSGQTVTLPENGSGQVVTLVTEASGQNEGGETQQNSGVSGYEGRPSGQVVMLTPEGSGQVVTLHQRGSGQTVTLGDLKSENEVIAKKESKIIRNNNKETSPYDTGIISPYDASIILSPYDTRMISPYESGNNTSPYDTSIIFSEGSSENLTTVSEPKSAHKKQPGTRPGKKYYDWKHYEQITPEDWTKAKTEGVFPSGESAVTLVIGAYLIAVKKKRQIEVGLVPGDFGKYSKLAKTMLEFMTGRADGDELQGFRDALEWVREFADCDNTTFIGKAGWSIQLAFARDVYRQVGTLRKSQGVKPGDRPKTGVNVIWSEAERRFQVALQESLLFEWLHRNAHDNPLISTEMADYLVELQDELIFVLKGRFEWDDQRVEGEKRKVQFDCWKWIDPEFGYFLDAEQWRDSWVITPEDANQYVPATIWDKLEKDGELPQGGRYTRDTKDTIDARLYGRW
jgi:DNA-binding transcriptional ArsR family regulator